MLQAEQSPYVAESRDSGDAQSQEVIYMGSWLAMLFAYSHTLLWLDGVVRTRPPTSGATVATGQTTPAGDNDTAFGLCFQEFNATAAKTTTTTTTATSGTSASRCSSCRSCRCASRRLVLRCLNPPRLMRRG